MFTQCYQNLKWLNCYAELNQLAMQKVVKKFTKEFLKEDCQELNQDLNAFIETKQIAQRKGLQEVIESLFKFFIVTIAKGDESKAR